MEHPTSQATLPGPGKCRLIQLPRVQDTRGNLTFVESNRQIPFEIKRVYYLYDVPGGEDRGGHGHKELEQVIVAMSGSFDVTVTDGFSEQKYHMNRSYSGLFIPKKSWRYLDNFSSGSVCLVLASEFYEEADYIRDYDEFLKYVRSSL